MGLFQYKDCLSGYKYFHYKDMTRETVIFLLWEFLHYQVNFLSIVIPINKFSDTVKCRYNAVFGVQEIDRVITVTAL